MDIDGGRLPTLVYMAREKRPHWSHNFKAGAMNALVRFQLLYMHMQNIYIYIYIFFFSLQHIYVFEVK